jgi:ribosomal protein S17
MSAKLGDTVMIAQCRRLSKMKSFVVTKVIGAKR